jgi:hypothetical protein
VAEEVMARVNSLSGRANETLQMLRSERDPLAALREEVAALSDRLASVGAWLAKTPEESPELRLRISPGALPHWGVATGYGWQDWREHRDLCIGLTEAQAAAFGMPDLGARMSLTSGRQDGIPVIEVATGRPAPGAADPQLDPAFPDLAADAIYAALCRSWTDPALAEACAALPSALSTPPAETPTGTPAEEPDLPPACVPPEEPDIPEACCCDQESDPEPGLEVERIILDPVTVTSYRPEPRPARLTLPKASAAASAPAQPPPPTEEPAAVPPDKAPAVPGLISTFAAPAPPLHRGPRSKALITQQGAALVHIQSQARKNHPR